MKVYKIIKCPHCGLPQFVLESQKSRKCPDCGKAINLEKVIIVNRTTDIEQAVFMVQQEKMRNKGKETFKSAADL
jgi:uncharacterized Zn finger protein (UPF0148 family)